MSSTETADYVYTDGDGKSVGIWEMTGLQEIVLGRNGGWGKGNVTIPFEDAPKFALEILKASGHRETLAAAAVADLATMEATK